MLLEFYPNLGACTRTFRFVRKCFYLNWVLLKMFGFSYPDLTWDYVFGFFYFMLDLLQICGFKSRRLFFFFFQIRIILSSNHINTLKVSSHTLLVNHADFTRTCIRLSSFLQEFTHWRITRVLLFFRTVAITAIPCPLLIRLSSVCPRRPV